MLNEVYMESSEFWSALHLYFLQWVLEFLFLLCFPREVWWLLMVFLIIDILLITLILTDINARNFSFTRMFYYCSVDNESKYVCPWKKKENESGRKRERDWKLSISRSLFLITNNLFDLGEENILIGLVWFGFMIYQPLYGYLMTNPFLDI